MHIKYSRGYIIVKYNLDLFKCQNQCFPSQMIIYKSMWILRFFIRFVSFSFFAIT